jgi:hypothetical protein
MYLCFAFPGPGGVLIAILDEMQRARDASAAAARWLDDDAKSIMGEGSANGASAENVGTDGRPNDEPARV